MGFAKDSYAKINSVETYEKYSICKISINKKNTRTKKYELSYSGNAVFCGKAHKQKPLKGQKIKLGNCDVTNCYAKNGDIVFMEKPRFAVFDYTLLDSSTAPSIDISETEYVEPDLPF